MPTAYYYPKRYPLLDDFKKKCKFHHNSLNAIEIQSNEEKELVFCIFIL